MKIEYWIIIIGIILAFAIGIYKNITYEEPIYFHDEDLTMQQTGSRWDNLLIDCRKTNITFIYEDNQTIEVCSWLRNLHKKGEEE